uniref:Uncharacterized protein n=1 Tax=Solanum tuberosum TaxID=4113 RepID=M1ALH6_SOLTU
MDAEVKIEPEEDSDFDHDKNLVNQEVGDDDNLILHVVAGANDRTTMVKDPIQQAMTSIQANEDFVDQEMDDDDDNLIINVVAGAKDRNTMFKDPTLEAITAIQNSLSKESRLATEIEMPNCQRSLHGKISQKAAKLRKKSPWKDFVSASSGATFSVLDILLGAIPGKEMQNGSDGVSEFSSDEKDEVTNDEKVLDHLEELDKVEFEDEVSSDEEGSIRSICRAG